MGHVTQVVGCCCARDYRNYGLGSQQRPVLHEARLQYTKFAYTKLSVSGYIFDSN